jgi:hypothetical protein
MKQYKRNLTAEVEAMEMLANGVLNHVPVENFCFRSKVIYIAHIIRRVLMTVNDRTLLDDKVCVSLFCFSLTNYFVIL